VALGEHRDARRQVHALGLALGQVGLAAAAGHALQPAPRATHRLGRAGAQLGRPRPAAGAEQQAQGALHLVQAHRRGGVVRLGRPGDQAVPLLADPLFHQRFSF
jgi:hypothetical protein